MCMREANTQARQRICADARESSLPDDLISTKVSCAGPLRLIYFTSLDNN